ncbi:hypothetical protein NQ314_000308, partial [Rhamnusium bicolor]
CNNKVAPPLNLPETDSLSQPPTTSSTKPDLLEQSANVSKDDRPSASRTTESLQTQSSSALSIQEQPSTSRTTELSQVQSSTSALSIQNQPSTSRTRKPTQIYSAEQYYWSSSEESEPFQDSSDSYIISENEIQSESSPTIESENDQHSSDDENPTNTATVTTTHTTWGPCKDLPVTFKFSAQAGLQANNLDLNDPYKTYRHFITDEILDIIVLETNRYASQYMQSHLLRPRSLLRKWTDYQS